MDERRASAREILDKDEAGPTRLRAKANDAVIELARGVRQSEVVAQQRLGRAD